MPKFALLFLSLYTAGLGSALFVDAVWGFYTYQLVYFFNPEARWWSHYLPGFRYSLVVSVILLITFIARHKAYSANKLSSIPQTKWMVLLLSLYFLVIFFPIDPFFHKKAVIGLVKLFIIIFIAYKLIDTVSKLDLALWSYILGATYIAMEAKRVGRNSQGRVEGIGTVDMPEANGTAASIAPTLIILIFYLWQGTSKYIKLAALICAAIIANGVVLINSRGSFVGIVIGSTFFLLHMLFSKVQLGRQRLIAVLIILSGLGGVLYVTDDLFWSRMQTIASDDERSSGSHRTHMWMSAIDLASDHPLGVGANGFQALSQEYVDSELFFGGQTSKSVHSSWFQLLSEIGWLGLFVYLCLLGSCFTLFRKVKKHLKEGKAYFYYQVIALEGALLTYMGAASFIDIARSEIFFWLITFCACAGNIYLIRKNHINPLAKPSN